MSKDESAACWRALKLARACSIVKPVVPTNGPIESIRGGRFGAGPDLDLIFGGVPGRTSKDGEICSARCLTIASQQFRRHPILAALAPELVRLDAAMLGEAMVQTGKGRPADKVV
jgi:hypothetical protein